MGSITCLNGGLCSTLQDRGRFEYQAIGVPVSGAMDRIALIVANRLVHNADEEAALEIFHSGTKLIFDTDMVVALAGADLGFKLNERSVSRYRTLFVNRGDVLSATEQKTGLYAYLAVRGGFKAPVVLKSQSTYMRGGFGGLKGRKLKSGDVLETSGTVSSVEPRALSDPLIQSIYARDTIGFCYGSQSGRFDQDAKMRFESSAYTISQQSDRMGYRLEGTKLIAPRGHDILSSPIGYGAIQVPGSGEPIVLLADSQTTGGYLQLGYILQSDLPFFVQQSYGSKLRFKAVTVDEGIEKWRMLNQALTDCLPKILPLDSEALSTGAIEAEKVNRKQFHIEINGIQYNVVVREK